MNAVCPDAAVVDLKARRQADVRSRPTSDYRAHRDLSDPVDVVDVLDMKGGGWNTRGWA